MANVCDTYNDLDDEETELKIPLRRGLDVRDLFNQNPVLIDIDCDSIAKESAASSDKAAEMYTYNEATFHEVVRRDLLDDGDDQSESLFTRLAKKMTKLTDDGGVLKRIKTNGDGVPLPAGATVILHYSAYLEGMDEPFDSTRLRDKPCRERLGRGFIAGFEIAIASMTQGERSEFMIKPEYAYGEVGCPPRIPENAIIYYDIELLEFVDDFEGVEYDEMPLDAQANLSFEKRMKAAKAKVAAGNNLYKQQMPKKACDNYKRAIHILEHTVLQSAEEEEILNKLSVRAYTNYALCYLQMEMYPVAITYARKTLELVPDHVKALYILGKAKFLTMDYGAAWRHLTKASKLDPNDSLIRQTMVALKKKSDEAAVRERTLSQRMLGLKVDDDKPLKSCTEKEFERLNTFINIFNEDDAEEITLPFSVKPNEIEFIKKKIAHLNIQMQQENERVHLKKIPSA